MKDELAQSDTEVLKSALKSFENTSTVDLMRVAANMSTRDKVQVLVTTIEKRLGRSLTAAEFLKSAQDAHEQSTEFMRRAEEAAKLESVPAVPSAKA